jgi:hypothetical protein
MLTALNICEYTYASCARNWKMTLTIHVSFATSQASGIVLWWMNKRIGFEDIHEI